MLPGIWGYPSQLVSRALSGKGRISEATRKRVLEYTERMQYSPNKFARALSGSRTFNIGVLIPGDAKMEEMSFFQDCLMGITAEGVKNDYDILLIYSCREDVSQLKKVVAAGKVDGVIITKGGQGRSCREASGGSGASLYRNWQQE